MSEFRARLPELLAKAWAGERLVVVHKPGNQGKVRRFVVCREEEMAEPLVFEPGDRVTWSSQAWGTTKEKRGTVVFFIPPWRDPKAIWESLNPGKKFIAGQVDNRNSSIPRYLVLVDRFNAKGKPLKSVHYAPRATALQELKDEARIS